MHRAEIERAIEQYMEPIFGFALKRCRTPEDAEDLSQEIVLRAFRGLLAKDHVEDLGKYIWTVAHNTLANYYRDTARVVIGVPIDAMAEILADPNAGIAEEENREVLRRLRTEIAYLSKLQRHIVIAYYFQRRRQADIAEELGIPLGTVKWHLFAAKQELKRGIQTMRSAGELAFHPIHFSSYGINGSIGTKTLDEFFRSALSQNICYAVRKEAKTAAEIGEELGVSPVYVESEVEYLERYGFLLAQRDRYLVNFLITEPTAELLTLQDAMYKQAADLFANDLYDALTASRILEDPGILCGQTDGPLSLHRQPKPDRNFLLWALIPYIAASCGEKTADQPISFEEVATLRPDGGHNIVHATVLPEHLDLPEDYVYMQDFCGPLGSSLGDRLLWQLDSQWSEKRLLNANPVQYSAEAERVLSLFARETPLSPDECAWLIERGYLKTRGDRDGLFQSAWQIVVLGNREVQKRLLGMGEEIQARHRNAFAALKAPYDQAVLRSVPAHLRRVKEYELQFTFYSNGWFLLHCIHALLQNGKLQEPTPAQRKPLSTLIVYP